MKIKPIKTFGSISVWANYFNPLKNDPNNPPIKDKDIYFVNLSSDERMRFINNTEEYLYYNISSLTLNTATGSKNSGYSRKY